MSDATKMAALRALRYAIEEIESGLKDELLDEFAEDGRDRWRTPFGTVSVAHPKLTLVFDEDDFMEWVKENHPTEIVTPEPQIRDSFRKAMTSRMAIIDNGTVVDIQTGLVVEWATARRTKEAYVSVTGPDKAAAIERAKALLDGRLDELTTGLAELTP
jgi:hypothetical protein